MSAPHAGSSPEPGWRIPRRRGRHKQHKADDEAYSVTALDAIIAGGYINIEDTRNSGQKWS